SPTGLRSFPFDLLDALHLSRRQCERLRDRAERVAVRPPAKGVLENVAANDTRSLIATCVSLPTNWGGRPDRLPNSIHSAEQGEVSGRPFRTYDVKPFRLVVFHSNACTAA